MRPEIQALRREVEEAAGPITEEGRFGERAAWWLVGNRRGVPSKLAVVTMRGGVHGMMYTASLAGRPLVVSIHTRRNTKVLGVPEVQTGDATFDAELVVNGWPAEVLQVALDEPSRRWLLGEYGGRDPRLQVESNTLHVFQYVEGDAWPDAMTIGTWIDFARDFGARLVASFDRRRAEIAQMQGPAVAEAWVQVQVQAQGARLQRRKRARVVILIAVLVLSLLPIVVTAVWLAARSLP